MHGTTTTGPSQVTALGSSLSEHSPHISCFTTLPLHGITPCVQQQGGHTALSTLRVGAGAAAGLTSALYLRGSEEVPCPDPNAGLHIRARDGSIVKATIGAEQVLWQMCFNVDIWCTCFRQIALLRLAQCSQLLWPASHTPSEMPLNNTVPVVQLAFQVGESMQVHSGGLLQATPHFVRACSGPAAVGVSRNTFAVFMQPKCAGVYPFWYRTFQRVCRTCVKPPCATLLNC